MRLYNLLPAFVALCGILAASAPPLQAGIQAKLEWSTDTYGHQLRGGEFKATIRNDTSPYAQIGDPFKTFCLEYHEEINLNTWYRATIDNNALSGGVGGGPSGDPLSSATRFFYTAYRSGTLGSLVAGFGTGTTAEKNDWADALQLVFWRLEEEVGSNWMTPGMNPQPDAGTLADANAIWNYYTAHSNSIDSYTNSAVKVLNLWSGTTGKQSQLYYDGTAGSPPVPPANVPEPATLAIWSLGLGIAGLVRLRRKK